MGLVLTILGWVLEQRYHMRHLHAIPRISPKYVHWAGLMECEQPFREFHLSQHRGIFMATKQPHIHGLDQVLHSATARETRSHALKILRTRMATLGGTRPSKRAHSLWQQGWLRGSGNGEVRLVRISNRRW